VVAPPLFDEGLLLALLRIAARLRQFFAPHLLLAPGLLGVACLLFTAGLFFALGSLLAQHLRIAIGRAARLLDHLRMRFAALLFFALGDRLPLLLLRAPGQQLFAPGLQFAARQLISPRLFSALRGNLLAPRHFGPPCLVAPRILGELHDPFTAPFRLGLFRAVRLGEYRSLMLAARFFLAAGLFSQRSLRTALLILRLQRRRSLCIDLGRLWRGRPLGNHSSGCGRRCDGRCCSRGGGGWRGRHRGACHRDGGN
jgi:hypothetical protein